MNPHTKAQVLTANQVATGSIVKVFATAASSKLVDCKFGNFVQTGDFNLNSSSIHQANTTDIPFGINTYLEGPFAAIHNHDTVIVVYYNGELKVS